MKRLTYWRLEITRINYCNTKIHLIRELNRNRLPNNAPTYYDDIKTIDYPSPAIVISLIRVEPTLRLLLKSISLPT